MQLPQKKEVNMSERRNIFERWLDKHNHTMELIRTLIAVIVLVAILMSMKKILSESIFNILVPLFILCPIVSVPPSIKSHENSINTSICENNHHNQHWAKKYLPVLCDSGKKFLQKKKGNCANNRTEKCSYSS